MASIKVASDEAINQMKSKQQSELLDAIDKLRREHIDAEISIPQIVVCGNQSSGKSSVLESLARVRFPAGQGVVTKFATEVVLRNTEHPSMKVSLNAFTQRKTASSLPNPFPQHDQDLIDKIEAFRPGFNVEGPEDFPLVIKAATSHLAHLGTTGSICSHLLRVEISGPENPHLTLVDLPGLISNDQTSNVEAGDMARIANLVARYMKEPRSIVVAIFDALLDQESQHVFKVVTSSAATQRTIGVITKPDRLVPGSDQEKFVARLAENEQIHLGLGWHVVRNLAHEDQDRSLEHHQDLEGSLFSSDIWHTLSKADLGVTALRQKLGRALFHSIRGDLTELIAEMRRKLTTKQLELESLGSPRESIAEQRTYLNSVAQKFARLVESSLEGDYLKQEFSTFFANDSNRTRETIREIVETFVADIRVNGQNRKVQGEGAKSSSDEKATLTATEQKASLLNGTADPSLYCKKVATIMSKCRGKTLVGQIPLETVTAIFREQSLPWEAISTKYLDFCKSEVQRFMRSAIYHVAGQHTGDLLWQEYIYQVLVAKSASLDLKLSELLWPYQKCHPMTTNRRYWEEVKALGPSETVTKIADEPVVVFGQVNPINDRSGPAPWSRAARDRKWNSELLVAAEAIDRAEAYYNIAVETFVENVATLAIEACLLAGLGEAIPAETVWNLDADAIAKLAAEPQGIADTREKTARQIKALKEAIGTCERHVQQRKFIPHVPERAVDATPGSQLFKSTAPESVAEKPSSFNSGSGFGRPKTRSQPMWSRNKSPAFNHVEDTTPLHQRLGSMNNGDSNAISSNWSGITPPKEGFEVGGHNHGLFGQPSHEASSLFGSKNTPSKDRTTLPETQNLAFRMPGTSDPVSGEWIFSPRAHSSGMGGRHDPQLDVVEHFHSITAHSPFLKSSFEVRS
ncbi:hypothetical protein M409DRAFT_25666 [Zasmidium cellare ATCC 36951]|uniref:Dynamin-type G domain-containing protein n=1 Tax=Zasmidium cellare ATCC 36951 TaxID=1080233 RepID=A0A6A6CCH5_ZASCE|nr:uncharacterized protein M409DRAFT_25666 [Zasmidium cellare ATCC 36951]KAF2163888.1 hypothetical protein M409DRAFT_25666 [Zasmidium cellare ATCC 36951]